MYTPPWKAKHKHSLMRCSEMGLQMGYWTRCRPPGQWSEASSPSFLQKKKKNCFLHWTLELISKQRLEDQKDVTSRTATNNESPWMLRSSRDFVQQPCEHGADYKREQDIHGHKPSKWHGEETRGYQWFAESRLLHIQQSGSVKTYSCNRLCSVIVSAK